MIEQMLREREEMDRRRTISEAERKRKAEEEAARIAESRKIDQVNKP